MEKIKAAFAGFGAAAKFMHAPFIKTNPGYEIVSVLERNKSESKELFPDAKIVRTYEELISDENIELIIITTPNDTHFSYTEQALRAGKNVVLEKPFTITSADGLQLIEIAKQTSKILSVFHNRRYVADFLTISEILRNNILGDIHSYEAHYHRYRPEAKPNAWREEPIAGSGIFYDLGSHLIDQALYLFGLPQSVTADIRKQRPHARVDDCFIVWLNYGFLKVVLQSGMLVREPGPRYMIHGTKGSFIKNGEDPQEAFLRAGKMPTEIENWGMEKEESYALLHTEINGNEIKKIYPSLKGDFGMYYENLYQTIRFNAPLRERPEHGYNTIRIIELAFESSNKKQTIICNGLLNVAYPGL